LLGGTGLGAFQGHLQSLGEGKAGVAPMPDTCGMAYASLVFPRPRPGFVIVSNQEIRP
jgi:hypothetical protein